MHSLYVCSVRRVPGPGGAGPGTRMMDRGGQLIAPLLTDTHRLWRTHAHTHPHTLMRVHTCLTPVPPWGPPAPEATAPETSKAQNDSACQQIQLKLGVKTLENFVGHFQTLRVFFYSVFTYSVLFGLSCLSVWLPVRLPRLLRVILQLLAAMYAMMTSGPLG